MTDSTGTIWAVFVGQVEQPNFNLHQAQEQWFNSSQFEVGVREHSRGWWAHQPPPPPPPRPRPRPPPPPPPPTLSRRISPYSRAPISPILNHFEVYGPHKKNRRWFGARAHGRIEADKDYLGSFHCINCNTQWKSAFAYKDTHQKCKKCSQKVTAHRFDEKTKYKHQDERGHRPHMTTLCQRCNSDKICLGRK
jgi:hypothetical protein